MGDLVVVAPVMAAREQALREHLRGLDPSPLARLPYETHFARFVILPVDGPRLFFSSRFDVSVARYLEALASLPEAAEIWGHCVGGGAGSLLAYLSKHRVQVALHPSGLAGGQRGRGQRGPRGAGRALALHDGDGRSRSGRPGACLPAAVRAMTLDPTQLQGNILRGYHFDHAAYLFVGVDDAAAGRALLGRLIDPVITEEEWGENPPWTLNVALSFAGLRAVGLSEAALARFPEEFRCGMAARADELGDVGTSAPDCWEDGFGSDETHLLLTLYAPAEGTRDAQLARWLEVIEQEPGLRAGFVQLAGELPDAREHFGFADGFSQPAVEGSGRDPRGEGVLRPLRRWRQIRLGEFVLGHRDEDGVVPAGDFPLLHDGTFMVWRKLEQNVALFRSWVREAAGGDPGEEEWIKAKIVGRWPNGDSLVRSPDGHDPGLEGRNRFLYGGDSDGLRCPVGAHVRRAYPRDALGFRTERTRRHRLLRRGMPYGTPLPEGVAEDDDVERGLIFVCLNASIARQFELVQGHWLNDGDSFGLGADRDFLLGAADPEGKMTVPGRTPRFLSPQEEFVRLRGGEYLFVPGMNALRSLASGA